MSDRRQWLGRCATLLLGLLAAAPGWAAEPAWPERLYNPQKAEGDLVQAMPGGGGMAFRGVELPEEEPPGDRRGQPGGCDERVAYAERPRADIVGGSSAERGRQGGGGEGNGQHAV